MLTSVGIASELEKKIINASIQVERDNLSVKIIPVVTWLQKPELDNVMYRYHLKIHKNNHSSRSTSSQSGVIPWSETEKEIKLSYVSHDFDIDATYDINLVILKDGNQVLEKNEHISALSD